MKIFGTLSLSTIALLFLTQTIWSMWSMYLFVLCVIFFFFFFSFTLPTALNSWRFPVQREKRAYQVLQRKRKPRHGTLGANPPRKSSKIDPGNTFSSNTIRNWKAQCGTLLISSFEGKNYRVGNAFRFIRVSLFRDVVNLELTCISFCDLKVCFRLTTMLWYIQRYLESILNMAWVRYQFIVYRITISFNMIEEINFNWWKSLTYRIVLFSASGTFSDGR